MIVLSFILSALAGGLAAALICKGIRLALWLDLLAGLGAIVGTWGAALLAGSDSWPLVGFLGGFGGVVGYLRVRGTN